MNQEVRIKKFTDLTSWQKGHQLVLAVYACTKRFPADEKFGLTNQMRRAAVSITSNLAEGFSRHSYSDKRHFYVTAQGSLTEVQNQLLIARDIHYFPEEDFQLIAEQAVDVHKLITGLIKSTHQKMLDS